MPAPILANPVGTTSPGWKPVVSCIVIFRNEERFLPEAIASVEAQSFRDWELLLVDDGSTDRSTDVARRIAAADPQRVRYLEHEGHANRGMSASRNLGIRNARGRYVAFLDADDVWLPDKLELQVEILERHPEAAMVYGATEYWFSWTGEPQTSARDFVPLSPMPPDEITRPPALLLGLLAEIPPAATCSILTRREALEAVGGFEESFRGLFEDQALLAKMYLTSPVFVSSARVARYRMHPGSHVFTEIERGRFPAARHSFLEWLEKHLDESGVRDPRIGKALHAARRRSRHPMATAVGTVAGHLVRRSTSRVLRAARAVRRVTRAFGKPTGSIAAQPNPILLSDPFARRFPVGVTTLSWSSNGAAAVEVRVGGPDGACVGRGGPSGSMTTGQWVTDGMTFFLQDVSGERPLSASNTLDAVEVRVRTARKSPPSRRL